MQDSIFLKKDWRVLFCGLLEIPYWPGKVYFDGTFQRWFINKQKVHVACQNIVVMHCIPSLRLLQKYGSVNPFCAVTGPHTPSTHSKAALTILTLFSSVQLK